MAGKGGQGGGRGGGEQKNAHFPHQRNSPHQTNNNFHVTTQYKLHLLVQPSLLYDFFNFRLYVQIYHASFDQSMVTESYLQDDKRIEWSKFLQAKFSTSFSSFNVIWETLLQLLLVFLFTLSLFDFKLYKFLLTPLQL